MTITTLKSLGFKMPAEWEKHEGTWLSWPKDKGSFLGEILSQTERIYIEMINVLQKSEKVFLLVDDLNLEERVRNLMEENGLDDKNTIFYHLKSVDIWTRDYGPIFVKHEKGNVWVTKWIFNSWGNKYEDLKRDDLTGYEMAKLSGKQIFKVDMVLEGGSIDVNGKGVLLTTEQCLLNSNRNPNLTRTITETRLRSYLGVDKIVWLKKGIAGDDTDGHVDDIARFVNENTVACAVEENANDENYSRLMTNFELLRNVKDGNGESLDIIKLPMPKKFEDKYGRLPASYANFYISNKSVLLPVFKDKNDETAIKIVQDLFPKREVIPIYSTPLIHGFGGIHCVTLQQPI